MPRGTSAAYGLAKDMASDALLGRNIKESIKHGLSRAKHLGMDALNPVVGRFLSSLSRSAGAPRKYALLVRPLASWWLHGNVLL